MPGLPEEYDKAYVVARNSLSASDWKMLDNSGYQIWHRPYFAMGGSTHSRIEINPHTKRIVDAGKVDAEVISFEEYLRLFEKEPSLLFIDGNIQRD